MEKKLFSKFNHFPVLPFASKLYLWHGIYAPHAYVTRENRFGKRNCTRALLSSFSSSLSCIYFLFFFFFRVLAYSISAKNNNCRSVTLPSRQDIVFKFSATWTERAARNSGCKRAGIVAPYTPFLLESRTCPRGFCSLQKAANNK